MRLNIKDGEAHRLARLLAEASGETMTKSVINALKERLSRVHRGRRPKATIEELRAISKRFRSHVKGPVEGHGTLLYDVKGMPK